ncbi:MAG TPA: hypothetical protein VK427_10490, partial [Kofleriaceae bacterium]|nr:hypothetical protein [Kofleriaceae bacterium]
LAPGVGAHAYVVVDEGDEVTRREIAVDAVIPNIVSAKVGAPLPEGEEVATTPPSPISRVERARIDVAPVEVPPVTTPTFLHARAPAADAPSGTAQTTAPPARIVNPPPSDGGPRLAARFERRVDTPLRQRPFTAAPPRTGWQEALVAWATRVLGDEPSMPLPTGASPLAALADRAQLDAPARRILAVLYADWLGGHGEVGLAGSKLVDLAGPTAWEEALGKGQLGLAGLVSSQVGRCLLARPIGAFLDGRSAEAARHVDGSGQRDVPDGWYRASVTVEALAARLGPVATCEGAIVVARLEAWARGWPLVVAAPPSPPARPGELVVVTSDHASLPPLPGVSPPQPT